MFTTIFDIHMIHEKQKLQNSIETDNKHGNKQICKQKLFDNMLLMFIPYACAILIF